MGSLYIKKFRNHFKFSSHVIAHINPFLMDLMQHMLSVQVIIVSVPCTLLLLHTAHFFLFPPLKLIYEMLLLIQAFLNITTRRSPSVSGTWVPHITKQLTVLSNYSWTWDESVASNFLSVQFIKTKNLQLIPPTARRLLLLQPKLVMWSTYICVVTHTQPSVLPLLHSPLFLFVCPHGVKCSTSGQPFCVPVPSAWTSPFLIFIFLNFSAFLTVLVRWIF